MGCDCRSTMLLPKCRKCCALQRIGKLLVSVMPTSILAMRSYLPSGTEGFCQAKQYDCPEDCILLAVKKYLAMPLRAPLTML